jgi:hypothetical protein
LGNSLSEETEASNSAMSGEPRNGEAPLYFSDQLICIALSTLVNIRLVYPTISLRHLIPHLPDSDTLYSFVNETSFAPNSPVCQNV